MTITQTINIPADHRLIIDVPREIPVGRAVVTFTPAETDETEYLMSFPANREHLNKAVENIALGENLITFENIDSAMQYADKYVAERQAAT